MSHGAFRGAVLLAAFSLILATGFAPAQTTTYTNGENNTSSVSIGSSGTLVLASGTATQSGPITGSGSITVNPNSSDTGTITFTNSDTTTGSLTIDFGGFAVSG